MNRPDVKFRSGNRIRELRRWCREGVVPHVGLDRSYIGGVDYGERNISLDNISLLAKGLVAAAAQPFEA